MMRSRGIVFTIVSAMLFGITPAFAKLIYADGINSSTLVFYRNLFAILPLFLLCLSQHCSFRINLPAGISSGPDGADRTGSHGRDAVQQLQLYSDCYSNHAAFLLSDLYHADLRDPVS